MSNDFKSQLSKAFTEEEKRKNEVLELITLPYKRELTKEEEKRYLSLDEKELPNDNILYTLYCMAKKFIETGEVDNETYSKCMKAKSKKISLEQVSGEWEKAPNENGRGQENER